MGRFDLPVLVFDGECGFCTWAATTIARSWTGPAGAVAWQRLGEDCLSGLGLTLDEAREAAWWVDRTGRRFRGHRAVAKALLASHGLKRWLGAVILVPPISWLAAGVYRLVVRYRHRLPGATPACRLDQQS